MLQSGTFLSGVVVDGVKHKTFVLRLPTVQDNIDAVDLVGTTNGVSLSTALFACQLVELGSLKPEQIDFDLLTTLHPKDYNLLEAASAELEKKRVLAETSEETSTAPGLPSVDSA